jgi:hypothetical protein
MAVDLLPATFDIELSTVTHSLNSIQEQVQEELLDLGWINGDKQVRTTQISVNGGPCLLELGSEKRQGFQNGFTNICRTDGILYRCS